MKSPREIILQTIGEIQQQQGYRPITPEDHLRVVKDLGFASLDIAQMIAMLEMEMGWDPFSQGVSITEVHTVGQLIEVYGKPAMAGAQS